MKKRPGYSIALLVMLLVITLSCNLPLATPTPTPQPTEPEPTEPQPTEPQPTQLSSLDQELIRNLARTEVALAQQKNPTATAVKEKTGRVEISYVYSTSLVTSLYHLYGNVLDNFVDITLTNTSEDSVTLIVETSIEGYTTQALGTVFLKPGEKVELHQNPRLVPEAVDRLNSEQPGNFTLKVTQTDPGPDSVLIKDSKEILLYSRRDFVWVDGFETAEEYKLWAAWVTPTDPAVEGLIRSAANYSNSGIITSGYSSDHQNDDDGSVYNRLQAIWQAEANDYRLTYVSTMVAFGPNTVQRIRMPSEVLNQASGNCIELALLYASAAEAMSLETAIIRIPGHAYMAVRTDQTNANYYFIETTMIGQYSFDDALNTGSSEWQEAYPHLDAKEEGYAWVTVQEAWKEGILPMPWK